MRVLGILLAAFVSFPTFAADILCHRELAPGRYSFASIDTWPEMLVYTGTKSCVGGGNVGLCFENVEDVIIDRNQVCGYRMNTEWECRSHRYYNGRTEVIETDCGRTRISARLEINDNGRGRMYCMRGNRVEKTWNLGTCN